MTMPTPTRTTRPGRRDTVPSTTACAASASTAAPTSGAVSAATTTAPPAATRRSHPRPASTAARSSHGTATAAPVTAECRATAGGVTPTSAIPSAVGPPPQPSRRRTGHSSTALEQPAREHADLHRRPDRPRAGRHECGDGGELAGREQVRERKRHRTDGTAARRVHGGGQARLAVGRCPRVEMQRGQDVDRRGGGHRQGRCENDACGAPTHQARHDITCAVSASPLRRAHGPVRPWQTPG